MKNTLRAAARIALTGLLIAWAGTGIAAAQWEPFPWKNMPRGADGKVIMDAPTRKTADGKPDFSGFWVPVNFRTLLDITAGMRPEDVPLTPWGRQVLQERIANNGKDHPGARCLPSGIPEKNSIPDGLKVVQTPDLLLFLYESRTIYRQVFMDGRPLPKNAQPAWMGYSIGKWEGDTLVVETIGQNGLTWLDMRGMPATEQIKVTERYTRPNIGLINIDMTIDDPKAYTKPWNVKVSWRLLPDTDLIESICEENNKAPGHMGLK